MGSMIEVLALDDSSEFFAPVSADLIDSLIGQHHSMRQRIEELYAVVTGETAGALGYVLEGNRSQDRYPPNVSDLFSDKGKVKAIANLDAGYWSKAMHMTDVLNAMPQKRRDEWHKSIQEMTCPAFEEDTVRSTFTGLLAMRSQFLAERVDGIFRGLSGEHVTNSPAAFGKRMIVSGVLSEYCGYGNHSACGLINDLRCVIAKFMGRDEPGYSASSGLVNSLKGNWGQWVMVDGGALKIRLYMKGTAHIEVHPDMAWRLNSVLAHIYPMAIPPEFRTKPKKKAKEITLIQRPLPFAVIDLLAQMKPATRMVPQPDNWRHPYRYESIKDALQYDHHGAKDKHALTEVRQVLESIGGVWTDGCWQFDYPPADVVNEIVASGCIPDQKAFQFYPTPASLAQRVVELAEIEPNHKCLEPSAGTAAIADLMPMDQTQCVEVSKLRCDVLTAKGHKVDQADFLQWQGGKFDRICQNPPFDRGQWQAHITHAASLLSEGGRLVAILPASAKNSASLPGFSMAWHGPFDNQFSGASVSVVILVAERSA